MHTPFVLQLLVTALNYMSVPDKNRSIITSASLSDTDPALYSISRTRCFTNNNKTIEGQCACTHRFSVLTPCSTWADMWHWTAERSCLNMTASFSLWLSSCKQSLTTCIWPNLESTSQGYASKALEYFVCKVLLFSQNPKLLSMLDLLVVHFFLKSLWILSLVLQI